MPTVLNRTEACSFYENKKQDINATSCFLFWKRHYHLASQPKALAPNTAASLSFNSENMTFTLPL